MIKFILILVTLFSFTPIAWADNNQMNNLLQIKMEQIKATCGPKLTDQYYSDIDLRQKYINSTNCVEEEIKKVAKNIFDENLYDDFYTSLNQTINSYEQIAYLLNEKTKNTEIMSGTLDKLNTQIEKYNFLLHLLYKIYYYDLLNKSS